MEPNVEIESHGVSGSNSVCASVLAAQLTNMAKNLTIEANLSQVLDDFLQKLDECDKYLANGIFNTNFAEAALLLQSSADLYGKKVDLLWDIIIDYQKHIILYDEKGNKEEEIQKLEERKRKYKRKRKINSDETQTGKLVSSFSFGATADNCDYLNQTCEPVSLLDEWKTRETHHQNNTSLHPVAYTSRNNRLFLPHDLIHNLDDNEYMGRYDQFHSASLIDEMFTLQENNLLADEHNYLTSLRVDTYLINDFLRERSMCSDKNLDVNSSELNEYIARFVACERSKSKDDYQICSKESRGFLEHSPVDCFSEKMRRISTADSLFDSRFDDDALSTYSDLDRATPCRPSYTPACPEGTTTASAIEGHIQPDCLNNNNNNDKTNGVDGRLTELPPESTSCELDQRCCEQVRPLENRSKSCSQDSAFYDCEDMDESATLEISTVIPPAPANDVTPVTRKNDNELCCASARSILKLTKLRSIIESLKNDDCEKKAKTSSKRRINIRTLKRLSSGTTVDLRAFERFYCKQYKAADQEGKPQDLAFLDADDSNDGGADDDFYNPFNRTTSPPCTLEDAENEISDTNQIINSSANVAHSSTANETTCNQSRLEPNGSSQPQAEAAVLPSSSSATPLPPELTEEELEEQELSRKNVREWRSLIAPKLKMMQNRSDFDIHEYGSKIIDDVEVGQTVSFGSIVRGQTAAEVARYFIATLQLANTSNVEISGAVAGKLANESFRLKVLDKTRHHELLDDYQAPSEETFRERLEQMRAMNSKASVHSTPYGPPPHKKPKLCSTSSKRRLF